MIQQKSFDKLRQLIYANAGIHLNDTKKALVSARVNKRVRALNLKDFDHYLQYLDNHKDDELINLIDVISTNFTHFFREKKHFEVLEKLIKAYQIQGQNRFRIWSCASSTGEEPYSLAITLAELLGLNSDTKILATDISTSVLAKCKSGIYEKEKLKAIPGSYLHRYFDRDPDNRNLYQVIPQLKQMLSFCWLNLSTPPFPMNGPFDAVFCRNVMIYFDNHVRQRLVNEIERLIRPGGLLMIGHSESLNGISHSFRTVAPSIYRKE